MGLSYLFLDPLLFRIGISVLTIAGLFITLGFDLFIRYSYDAKKLIIYGSITTGIFMTVFQPASVDSITFPSGINSFKAAGPLLPWTVFLSIFVCFIYSFYCIQIYRKSSKDAKKSAFLNLIGGIIFGIVTMVGFIIGLNNIIPGFLGISLSVGALISSIAFTLDPRLVRVLLATSDNAKVKLRRQLEDRLILSEERFRNLVETMDEIIYEFDLLGNCIYTNKSHERLLGYPIQDFNILKIQDLIHIEDSDKFSSVLMRIKERKGTNNIKIRVKSISGKYITFLLNIAPIFDPSKKKNTGFIVLARDIDKMEKSDLRLIRSQKMESIGKLAGGVAHDFNNFLQAILGYTDILLFDTDENSDKYEFIQKIKTAAKNAANITRQLLILSRQQEIELQALDINQEIIKINLLLKHSIPKMIDIKLDLSKDIKLIHGDPTQIQQIIMNLVINARDAMPNGGKILIRTQNTLLDKDFCEIHTDLTPGEYCGIYISDDGIGMSKEILTHLFEPFYTTKSKEEGAGLGLSIVYNIVKKHRGTIQCYSESGIGTEFKIYLPSTDEEKIIQIDQTQFEDIPKGSETILIIDDEKSILEYSTKILMKFGYKVVTATSGERGFEMYTKSFSREKRIDLIILDLIMPGMGGMKCLENIVSLWDPLAKIIISSGLSMDDDIDNVIKKGAKAFIKKPFNTAELLKLIRVVLDTD
jgi:PAS domain S-box-containing protein